MKKNEVGHRLLTAVLLTFLCWIVVNQWIIPMNFSTYIYIEILLLSLNELRTLALRKILNIPDNKQCCKHSEGDSSL
jgi:hypothetical protein